MSKPVATIIQHHDHWSLALGTHRTTLAANATGLQLAEALSEACRVTESNDVVCVMAPASTSCFFVVFDLDPDLDPRDRAALIYELENHVPLDAESMVADFMVLSSHDDQTRRIAALAIPCQPWEQIIEEVESKGFEVVSLLPAALLAVAGVDDSDGNTSASSDDESMDRLVLVGADGCDVVTIRGNEILAWKHFADVHVDALRRSDKLLPSSFARVIVYGGEESDRVKLAQIYPEAEFRTLSIDEMVQRGADRVVKRREGETFRLRRDRLAPADPLRPIRGPIRLLTFAVLFALLATIGATWWRRHRVEKLTQAVRQRQAELFRQAFPNTRVPAAVLRRVRSEYAKAIGSRGADAGFTAPTSASDVLRTLLAALPESIRFRIRRIEITDGRVNLDLQVRSPVDAGALATSLTKHGFDVQPPVTTQEDARTYHSVLQATWVGTSSSDERSQDVSARTRQEKDGVG